MSNEGSGDLFATGVEPLRSSQPARTGPLAERMRPQSLDEVVGQRHLLGEGHLLAGLVSSGRLASMILWGPAGSGKTTLARLLASAAGQRMVELSATSAGVRQVRETAAAAADLRKHDGGQTVLFVDEIHRFNKGQQDALLPWVENGTVCLLGATTENPSFEVNSPLLSRSRVVRLEPLQPDDLMVLLGRALATEAPRGLGGSGVRADPALLRRIAELAQGDARVELGTLELAVGLVQGRGGGDVNEDDLAEAVQMPFLRHDAEDHFNEISALQKSIRNSNPSAAVYWLARLLEAGDDAMYVARRLLVTASEDVGLADPAALAVASAGLQAVHALGMPEARIALAEVTVYLATAPKSNSAYRAYAAAAAEVERSGSLPVPMHLRNAVTAQMRAAGYGQGYRDAHDEPDGVAEMDCLPEPLRGVRFYEPVRRGAEAAAAAGVDAAKPSRRDEPDA